MDQGVGHEVKRLREECGWSQAKLAVEADMSVSGVSMIENGQRNLTTTTLAKLASAFGVEVADLFPKEQSRLPFENGERRTTKGYDLSASSRPDYIESVEPVGRPILALLDFPTAQMREYGRGQRDYVSGLPKDLPFEEVVAHLQRMRMFLYWYRFLTWQLSRENFTTAVYPWHERLAAGAPVPKDIQQAIRDFKAAWKELESEAVPLTLEWVDRERYRNVANNEIARLSAEMDHLIEEQRESARDMLIRQ